MYFIIIQKVANPPDFTILVGCHISLHLLQCTLCLDTGSAQIITSKKSEFNFNL